MAVLGFFVEKVCETDGDGDLVWGHIYIKEGNRQWRKVADKILF